MDKKNPPGHSKILDPEIWQNVRARSERVNNSFDMVICFEKKFRLWWIFLRYFTLSFII